MRGAGHGERRLTVAPGPFARPAVALLRAAGSCAAGTWAQAVVVGDVVGVPVNGQTRSITGDHRRPWSSGATPFEACGPCTPDEVVRRTASRCRCSVCNGECTETGYFYYDLPDAPGAVLCDPNCTEEGPAQTECTVAWIHAQLRHSGSQCPASSLTLAGRAPAPNARAWWSGEGLFSR